MQQTNWIVMGVLGLVTSLGLLLPNNNPSNAENSNTAGEQSRATATAPGCCQAGKTSCPDGASCDESKVIPTDLTLKPAADKVACTEAGCQDKEKNITCGETPCEPGKCCDKSLPITKLETASTNKPADEKTVACEGGQCPASDKSPAGDKTTTITVTGMPINPVDANTLNFSSGSSLQNLSAALAAVQESKPADKATVCPTGECKAGVCTGGACTATTGEEKAACCAQAVVKSPREQRLAAIEKQLAGPWSLGLKEVLIQDLAATLRKQVEIPVVVDHRALEEAGFDGSTTFTVEPDEQFTVGSQLLSVLNAKQLTWTIPESQDQLLITTPEAAAQRCYTRVYPVRDLVAGNANPEQIKDNLESLVQMIPNVVAEGSWNNNGGIGQVWFTAVGDRYALVVRNHYHAQRETAELIEQLRQVAK